MVAPYPLKIGDIAVKKAFMLLLLLAFALNTYSIAYAESPEELVFQIGNPAYWHNGQEQKTNNNPSVAPFVDRATGRTLIPLRCLAEILDFIVDWNQEEQYVTLDKSWISITITIGKENVDVTIYHPESWYKVAYVGKTEYKPYPLYSVSYAMDTVPVVVNGRTFVPLRFISDLFGYEAHWEKDIQTVTITKQNIRDVVVSTTFVRQSGNDYQIGVAIDNRSKIPLCVVNPSNFTIQLNSDRGKLIPVWYSPVTTEMAYGTLIPGDIEELFGTAIDLAMEPGHYRAYFRIRGEYSLFDEPMADIVFEFEFDVM